MTTQLYQPTRILKTSPYMEAHSRKRAGAFGGKLMPIPINGYPLGPGSLSSRRSRRSHADIDTTARRIAKMVSKCVCLTAKASNMVSVLYYHISNVPSTPSRLYSPSQEMCRASRQVRRALLSKRRWHMVPSVNLNLCNAPLRFLMVDGALRRGLWTGDVQPKLAYLTVSIHTH